MIEQERVDRERKWVNYFIAAVFGGGTIALLVCGGLFVVLARESGESSPQESERWFKTVVQFEPSLFTDIQHYTDQGIDVSHHFRFRFTDAEDLAPIIKHHELAPTQSGEPTPLEGLPDWYDPHAAPIDAPKFGCSGAEPILLIVDPDAKIAYFELVHL